MSSSVQQGGAGVSRLATAVRAEENARKIRNLAESLKAWGNRTRVTEAEVIIRQATGGTRSLNDAEYSDAKHLLYQAYWDRGG